MPAPFETFFNVFPSTGVFPPPGPPRNPAPLPGRLVECLLFTPATVNWNVPAFTHYLTCGAATVVYDAASPFLGSYFGPGADYIECPAGSGHFYLVDLVLVHRAGTPSAYLRVYVRRAS